MASGSWPQASAEERTTNPEARSLAPEAQAGHRFLWRVLGSGIRVNSCTKTHPDLEPLRGYNISVFQFKWQTPAPDSENIILEVHSRSDWFGRKVLRMGGQTLYRRGRFAGIEHRFSRPDSGHTVHLRFVAISGTPNWRPAPFFGDAERPEQTHTEPSQPVKRPRVLGVADGIACHCILIAVERFSAHSTLNSSSTRLREVSLG